MYVCLVQQKTLQALQSSAINKIPNIPQCTLPPQLMCQTLLSDFSRVWLRDYPIAATSLMRPLDAVLVEVPLIQYYTPNADTSLFHKTVRPSSTKFTQLNLYQALQVACAVPECAMKSINSTIHCYSTKLHTYTRKISLVFASSTVTHAAHLEQ